jgi:hypothetical protein
MYPHNWNFISIDLYLPFIGRVIEGKKLKDYAKYCIRWERENITFLNDCSIHKTLSCHLARNFSSLFEVQLWNFYYFLVILSESPQMGYSQQADMK